MKESNTNWISSHINLQFETIDALILCGKAVFAFKFDAACNWINLPAILVVYSFQAIHWADSEGSEQGMG